MFVLVVHTILTANCVRPNTTIGNYFCVGGPATLYNEDDKMSLGETNCPGVGDDVPKALLDDGTPFPSEVRGERCACDWGSQKPDPLILQRTQLITCNASVGPLHTNMSYIQKQLKRGQNITLMGQCPRQRDKCVGFYTNAWIDGNDVKLPGVCQASRYSAADAKALYKFPAANSRLMEQSGDGDNDMCDCHSQRPEWRSLRLFSKEDTFIDNIFRRATGSDFVEGGPCEAIELGWGWRWASDPAVSPVILTMPPGESNIPVRVVEKSGTEVYANDNSGPYSCGAKTPHPVGSITLKDYCAIRPASVVSMLQYQTGRYRVEPAAIIYGIRNLLNQEQYLKANNIKEFMGLDVTGGLFEALLTLSNKREKRTNILLIAILSADLRLGTSSKLRQHPPRWHGNEGFPSSYDPSQPDFHIGTPDFAEKIVDENNTVSPFRLLFYHFSTAVVDYGKLVNNNPYPYTCSNSTCAGSLLNWDGVKNTSGSFLGTNPRFDSNYASGYESRYHSLFESITGRLTLPGMGLDRRGCYSAHKEKMCYRYFGDPVKNEHMKRACDPQSDELDVDAGCVKFTTGVTITSILENIEDHRFIPPFNSTQTNPAACIPLASDMFGAHLSPIEKLMYCLQIWDVAEQFWQVIRYALPLVLTPEYFDMIQKEWNYFTNKETELFKSNVVACDSGNCNIMTEINSGWAIFAADLDWNLAMWTPVDTDEWNALCEERVFPVPGYAGGGSDSGCETVRDKPTGPFDGYSHTTGRCEQLTSLPFGLDPSSDEIQPVYEEVATSEAVAAAAWPFLAPNLEGFERLSPVDAGDGMEEGDIEAELARAGLSTRLVEFFAAKCSQKQQEIDGDRDLHCFVSPTKGGPENDYRVLEGTTSFFIFRWLLIQNDVIAGECNRHIAMGDHCPTDTSCEAAIGQNMVFVAEGAVITVDRCLESIYDFIRLRTKLRDYHPDDSVFESLSRDPWLQDTSIATIMLGQVDDRTKWTNRVSRFKRKANHRGEPIRKGNDLLRAVLTGTAGNNNDHSFFFGDRNRLFKEDPPGVCGAGWSNNPTMSVPVNGDPIYGGNVYWSMIGGNWLVVESQHLKQGDPFYDLERGGFEDIDELLKNYSVRQPAFANGTGWRSSAWTSDCVESLSEFFMFRNKGPNVENHLLYYAPDSPNRAELVNEAHKPSRFLYNTGDRPNVTDHLDGLQPSRSTLCNLGGKDVVTCTAQTTVSKYAEFSFLGCPLKGDATMDSVRGTAIDPDFSTCVSSLGGAQAVHQILYEKPALILANFGYLAAAKALPWAFHASKHVSPVIGCASHRNSYPNRNGNILGDYMELWPTAGCKRNSTCAYFSENGVLTPNTKLSSKEKCQGVACASFWGGEFSADPKRDTKTQYGRQISPQFRLIPSDDTTMRVKLNESSGNAVSPALLMGRELWSVLADYRTLRSDTAWGQTKSQRDLLNSNENEDNDRCTFNRCTQNRPPAYLYSSAYRVHATSFDAETGTGMCYAKQTDDNDMNANALYRRRSYVTLPDSAAGITFVLPTGETAGEKLPSDEYQQYQPTGESEQLYDEELFKNRKSGSNNPLYGDNPNFYMGDSSDNSGTAGMQSILRQPTEYFNVALDDGIDSTRARDVPCYYLEDTLDDFIIDRTPAQLDLLVGVVNTQFLLGGETDLQDIIYQGEIPDGYKTWATFSWDKAYRKTAMCSINPYGGSPLLDPQTGEYFNKEGTFGTYGRPVEKSTKRACGVLGEPFDQMMKNVGKCNGNSQTSVPPIPSEGGLTKSEQILDQWIRHLIGKDGQNLTVAIGGSKLRVKITGENRLQTLRSTGGRVVGNDVVEIDGEKDGVPFFEHRTMKFPTAWRVIARAEGVEKPAFLNPNEKIGLSPEQGRVWCAAVAEEETCWHHRACTWTGNRCTFNEDEPDCSDITPPKNASWSRPCMHPAFPVCVQLRRLPQREGVPLTGDGSMFLSKIGVQSASCVPLTRKIRLDASNYKTLFNKAQYWRPNCAFAVGKHVECRVPPQKFMGEGDSVTGGTSIKDMSKWIRHTHPVSFFRNSPITKNFTWGFDTGMPRRDIENIHNKWTHQDVVTNGGGHPFATLKNTPGYPNCGPGDNGCGLLIDNITSVPCPSYSAGHWSGRCIKPELQLTTPDEFKLDTTFLANAYQSEDGNLPYRRTCPVYEPAEQYMASVPRIMWPPESVKDDIARLSNSFEHNKMLEYIHYCHKYASLFTYCDNDPLSVEERTELCERWGGDMLYTGVTVTDLKVTDMCDPTNRVCYLMPNTPNIGTLKTMYQAAREAYGSLAGFTFKVLTIDYSILKNLLLGAMLENVGITNMPSSKATADGCNPDNTFLCLSPGNGNGQAPAGEACYEDPALGLPEHEKLIRGQHLFEKGAAIGQVMCNPHRPPDLEVFQIIKSLQDNWNKTARDGDVYRIIGTDSPSHTRNVYDSRIEISVSAFEVANLSAKETLKVIDSGVTIEPAFDTDMIHMGDTRIEVVAEGFTIRKAIFYSHDTPIMFSGTSADDATIVNVTSKHSPMTLAFLGAATDFTDYAPAVSVRNVMLEHVSGSEFIAGFARAIGEPRVVGCPPSLSGGSQCYIPTPTQDPCSTWGSAYDVPAISNKGQLWDDYESWVLAGHNFVTTNGNIMNYNRKLLQYKNKRLMVDTMCLHVRGVQTVLGGCDSDAAHITRTGHMYGDPFRCLRQAPGDHRPAVVICKPCSVGSTPTRVHVNTTGINCTSRPVGLEILACTPTPNGAVHELLDTSICDDKTGLVAIPGGHGGLYDCDTRKIMVGGYGYTSSAGHKTTAILIQPEEHMQQFDVEAPGVEIVNITEVTGIFGRAYVESFIHAPPRQVASALIILILLASVLGALIIIHFGLVYYEQKTIFMLLGKPKLE